MNEAIERLKLVRQRITAACVASGRAPGSVSLLAVSKRHPAGKISELRELGVMSFGENQLQEALVKQKELCELALEWHYIGAIQSNKTRAIAENFQWVQSADRERILNRLSDQRPTTLGPLNICLQVNVDGEEQKAGASPEEILKLAELTNDLDNIKLRGLMAIPRMSRQENVQRDSFQRVRDLYLELKTKGFALDTLSMGMSADLETAIDEGSTMVRIGTDLFGQRNT